MIVLVPLYKRITSEYRWFVMSSNWERQNSPNLSKYGLDLPLETELVTFVYHQPRPKKGDRFYGLKFGNSTNILFYPDYKNGLLTIKGDVSKVISNSNRIMEAKGLDPRLRFGLESMMIALDENSPI